MTWTAAGGAAIVVTGAHRSGTTVLGDLVCRAPGTWTVWEPLNQHWGLRAAPVPYRWCSPSAQPEPALAALDRYLRTGCAAWSVKRGPGGSRLPLVNEQVRRVRRRLEWQAHRSDVAVVKDPFLLLALQAVQGLITTRPAVVAVRHPCSWLLSLRRVSWPAGPELNMLIAQEELYETHLRDLLPRRDWTREDDLEAAARAWACLYHLVRVQEEQGAAAVVVAMEQFGRDPVPTMRTVYNRLGLVAPAGLAELAETYTGAGNAVTPTSDGRVVHLLNRDSRALSQAWRSALPAAAVARVRSLTEAVYDGYYASWDDPEASAATAAK